jgi:hypothetical protein
MLADLEALLLAAEAEAEAEAETAPEALEDTAAVGRAPTETPTAEQSLATAGASSVGTD